MIIPTTNDITIENNGKRIGVANAYKATSHDNKLMNITLFGVCPTSESITFDWDNFNVIIKKPDKRIIYSDCKWSSMTRDLSVIEAMEIISSKRLEIG